MPAHPKVVTLKPWKGLNNTNSPHTTPPEYLKTATNVDVYGEGVTKREGYSKVLSGGVSSLWASNNGLGCYGVIDGDLVEIYSDYSLSSPLLVVGSSALSFEEVDNKIYLCNKGYTGILEDGFLKGWGIPKTNPILSLSTTTGNLLSGEYQVSYTVVNSDGIESGCSEAQVVTIPTDHSGITFSIGTISNGDYARIYCSTQNGKILFYSGMCLPNSTYTISSVTSLSNPLRTFNLDKAPTGQIVKYYNGRLYVAQDNILWYSEKYQYQHFNLSSNYIEFPTRIKEVMPVESGIWIGSDRLYFLSGSEPDKFDRLIRDSVKVVEGTSTRVNGLHALQPLQPALYYWMVTTNLGIYSLMEQGTSINQSISQVEVEGADSGTSLLLRSNGMTQYLSMLKLNGTPNNSTVGDMVESTIIRNGIIIK